MRKMRKVKLYIGFVLMWVSVLPAMGQDINFSQFYELPMLRNPALAGIFAGDVRVTSAYRNQWENVTVPYRSFALGTEYKKSIGENSDDFITFGFQATSDVAGDSRLSRTQVFPVMNYNKSLGGERAGYISAGIMGGVVMQHFDPSRLTFDDQFVNGAYSASNPTKQVFTQTGFSYWDVSAGLSYSSVAGQNIHYYLGLGLFHITEPKVAFQQQYDVKMNRKWMVNMGLSVPLNDQNSLIVYGDYFMQGGARQGQGGALFNHDLSQFEDEKITIAAGMFYRGKDAFIPVVKLNYYHLGLGITYDVNSSKLKTASQYRGGFELTLSYKAYRNNYNSSANKVKCPSFY